MKILSEIKLVLTWLWLYEDCDVESNLWMKLAHALFGFSTFAIITSFTVASTIFFVKFATTDLEEILYAFFHISAFSGKWTSRRQYYTVKW